MSYGLKSTEMTTALNSGNLGAGTGVHTAFANTMGRAFVQNHPNSPDLLYLKWNTDSASDISTSDYDAVLSAGDFIYSLEGVAVKSVGLLSPSALTEFSHFNARGYPLS